jgi:hypothetical protein
MGCTGVQAWHFQQLIQQTSGQPGCGDFCGHPFSKWCEILRTSAQPARFHRAHKSLMVRIYSQTFASLHDFEI